MITIQLGTVPGVGTQPPWDTASTIINGVEFSVRSRTSAVTKLARMISPEIPDTPWIAIGCNGTPSMKGPSIHRIAAWTVSESDKVGIRWVKWKEFPKDARNVKSN